VWVTLSNCLTLESVGWIKHAKVVSLHSRTGVPYATASNVLSVCILWLTHSTDKRSTAIFKILEPSVGVFNIKVRVSSPFASSPKIGLVNFTVVAEIESVALSSSPSCPITLNSNDNVWATDVVQFEAR
jgi:hypothetical protein